MKNKDVIKIVGILGILALMVFLLYQIFVPINFEKDRDRKNYETIYWNGQDISEKVLFSDEGNLLVEAEEIVERGYEKSWIDSKNKRFYLVYDKAPYHLENDYLNQNYTEELTMNILMIYLDGKYYIDISEYQMLFGLKIYKDFEKGEILVSKDYLEIVCGEILNSTYIRPRASYFHRNYRKMNVGEKFEVIERKGGWSKILTQDGLIGYVKRKAYNQYIAENHDRKINEVRGVFESEEFNLIWHQIGKNRYDLKSEERLEKIDVIAPTWFSLANSRGYIINNADRNYVKNAHEKGYKVWALVDNSFDNNLTRAFLNNQKSRTNFIKLMVNYAAIYDLDGINIDFENIYYDDRAKFTKFVKEFHEAVKNQNLVTSIAISVPNGSPNWSLCYERDKLAQIVDYCALMAYDEHWASSPKSGSVASYPWIKKNIEETLKEVPKDKLLLGIPFYMRKWTEKNGKVLRSKAISMSAFEKIKVDKKLKPVWLDKEKQYFAEYKDQSGTQKIWVEDKKSVYKKMELIDEFGLVGSAFWKKGLETTDVWIENKN